MFTFVAAVLFSFAFMFSILTINHMAARYKDKAIAALFMQHRPSRMNGQTILLYSPARRLRNPYAKNAPAPKMRKRLNAA